MYSSDLQSAAVRMYLQIASVRKVGKLLSIGKSTVHRWLSTNPLLERRARQQRVSNTILAAIHAFVLKRPFALRKDVIESVRDTFSLKLSASSISRALHSLGLRRKRTSYVPYIDRAVAEKRQAFGVKLADTPMAQTVCIDETAFQFDMFPSYGYAPSGCRLLAPRRHKAYCRRFSVIAAVTSSEVLAYKIIQGSVDSSAFSGFVTALPVGEDHRFAMCDNVAFQRSRAGPLSNPQASSPSTRAHIHPTSTPSNSFSDG